MQPITLTNERELHKDQPLNNKEIKEFRSLLGQLSWAVSQAKSDLSFDLCLLCRSAKDCTTKELIKLNKLLEKAKRENVRLRFEFPVK